MDAEYKGVILTTEFVDELVRLETAFELELELELDDKLLLDNRDCTDDRLLDLLLNDVLDELEIITTTEFIELEAELFTELWSELFELARDELTTALLREEAVMEETEDELELTKDDSDELLDDDIARLLDESDEESPPPHPVSNITITAIILISSKLRLDRPTTLIVTKTLPSNTWLLSQAVTYLLGGIIKSVTGCWLTPNHVFWVTDHLPRKILSI